MDPDSLPFPAYDDGQQIAYFSRTHQQWMCGTIESEVCSNNVGSPRLRVSNNVTISQGGQFRADVGLDALRAPFRPGELVEVFSGRRDGIRLAARISAEQRPAPSVVGYQVQVDGSGEVFTNVPPLRLKRRFPRGQLVEVYRGPELGWQSGQVHQAASMDGCEAEILPVPGPLALLTDADSVMSQPIQSMAKPKDEPKSKPRPPQRLLASGVSEPTPAQPPKRNDFTASNIGLWTWVPLCAEGVSEDDAPEWVPSYLVCTPACDLVTI